MDYLICQATGLPTQQAVLHLPTGSVFDAESVPAQLRAEKGSLLPLGLREDGGASAGEILERQSHFLELELGRVASQNRKLAEEIAVMLLKNKTMSEQRELLVERVREASGKDAPQPPASPSGEFWDQLRNFYRRKIQANRETPVEVASLAAAKALRTQTLAVGFQATKVVWGSAGLAAFVEEERINLVDTGSRLIRAVVPGTATTDFLTVANRDSELQLAYLDGEVVTVVAINLLKGEQTSRSVPLGDKVIDLQFHPDFHHLLVFTKAGIAFVDCRSGSLTASLSWGVECSVARVHPDGKLVALVSEQEPSKVRFFDLFEGKTMVTFQSKLADIQILHFSPDRFHLLLRGEGAAEVVDIRTRKPVGLVQGVHPGLWTFAGLFPGSLFLVKGNLVEGRNILSGLTEFRQPLDNLGPLLSVGWTEKGVVVIGRQALQAIDFK